MTGRLTPLLHAAGRRCRAVVAALLSGLVSRLGVEEIEARLAARPPREQVLLVGGVLALLFLLSLLAAQAGWVGMLGFWLAVILIAR
jgi:hypothetical protein